jgi:hypothetical protein
MTSDSLLPRRSRRLLLPFGCCLTLLFGAGRMVPSLGAQVSHPATRQKLDLFGSVVQTLLDSLQALRGRFGQSSISGSALTVDPRPFHSRASGGPEDELMVASMRTLAVADPALLEARTRQLKNLRVPEGDALALNDCPGALVPAPASAARMCPDHSLLVAMLSLPDSIGPRRFVQVLVLAADSLSKTALVLGYVMEPRGDRWALVSQRLPVFVE